MIENQGIENKSCCILLQGVTNICFGGFAQFSWYIYYCKYTLKILLYCFNEKIRACVILINFYLRYTSNSIAEAFYKFINIAFD